MRLGADFAPYSVGFVFSDDTAAGFMKESGERWLLLNPYKDIHMRSIIWSPSKKADLKWLYSAAIHECTHFADGIGYHDESFAAALTHNMAICVDGFRKITAITASIRGRGGIEVDVSREEED